MQTNDLPDTNKTFADEFWINSPKKIKERPVKTVIQSTKTYRKANVTSHIKKRSDHGELNPYNLSTKKKTIKSGCSLLNCLNTQSKSTKFV